MQGETFPGQHTMTMLLNWKRCTQKAIHFQFQVSTNFVGVCLSWVLVYTCFPFLLARHRFRNVCCLRKHLTKVVLRFFRLLCFIPILHSKTWVVHMAANIEVTSVKIFSKTQSDTYVKNLWKDMIPREPMLQDNQTSPWNLEAKRGVPISMPSCKGSRHQKWAWQANRVRKNGVRSMVVHLKAPFKQSF